MRSRGRAPISRTRLFVECLEDRSTPAGLADPLAGLVLADAPPPADKVNVVTGDGGANAGTLAELSAAPFAASVRHIGFGIYNVTLKQGTDRDAAVTYYSAQPGVSAAEPDFVIQVNRTPNDTQYTSLYGMTRISAPTAWDTSVGSGNFVVAVIDSGIDYNHPDLAANVWTNPGEIPGDGIDNDGDGVVDDVHGANYVTRTAAGAPTGNPMDDNGHGTHVSGTIGAVGNNSLGVVGVNWNVKIMALKFLNAQGSGSTSAAVEALNFAVAHGVKVSNNSWGGGGYSGAMFAAIQNAQTAGHIFVAAAGNSAQNIDTTPSYPASYNLANVVAVAATTSTDALASYSNYGTATTDIAAPGSGIISTTPNNTYSNYSGTSMATPHVVGAIALYWDANPTATAAQVISRLTSTADSVAALTPYVPGGRRLNVGAMLQGVSPPPPPTDTTGARVTAAAFAGTTSLTSVRFTFSEAINAATFTLADIASFTGPGGAIVPTSVTAVSSTQFDVTFPTQTAAGTYTMVIGPNILDLAGNPMDQDNDAINGEATQDQYTATRALTTSSTTTFTAGGLPLAIRDFQYSRSTITINQDITISDLNVKFGATHTWDGDLVVKLTGPGGQVATLVNRRGGSGDNFTNTTLDDEATTAIASGAAPFSGTYRPETTLTTFDGRNARGVWTLEVYDAAAQDVGNLTAFSLVVTGTNGGLRVQAFGFAEGVAFREAVQFVFVAPVVIAPVVVDVPTAVYLFDVVGHRAPLVPVDAPVAVQLPPAREDASVATAATAFPPLYAAPGVGGEEGSWEDWLAPEVG